MNMVHGIARFYNKGSISLITIKTPFGYVTASNQSTFDLYLNDTSLEVRVVEGSVYFNRDEDHIRTEVIERSASRLADRYMVTARKGYGDPDWDTWNNDIDALWA